jgi:ABC-2 type transport system ATP-binding protein
MSEDHPISVYQLSKHFGNFTAVDKISFQVQRGEIFGWLGPNGAGKTTTMRILLGLLKASAGEVRVLGLDPQHQAKAVHVQVGYMSQQFTLYNDLSVRENIWFYGQAYGLSYSRLRQRFGEVLELAGLVGREGHLTGSLSGGWKQRLALGCSILHEPQVLFLDEPTAGVDPISRREFWKLIYHMAQNGLTIMVTTHYMDEAELCQRVGFIQGGQLTALDTPQALKRHMPGSVLEIHTPQAESSLQALKQAKANRELDLEEIALYGAQIHVVVKEAGAGKQQVGDWLAQHGLPARAIEPIEPSLEDVFITAMKSGGSPKPGGA